VGFKVREYFTRTGSGRVWEMEDLMTRNRMRANTRWVNTGTWLWENAFVWDLVTFLGLKDSERIGC